MVLSSGHFPDAASPPSFAIPGGDAVLRCELPSVASDLLQVVAWEEQVRCSDFAQLSLSNWCYFFSSFRPQELCT